MKTNLFIMLMILALAMPSCHTSKHFYKVGTKQENGGLLNEAAESYFYSLQRSRNNVDAQIAMKRSGQLVLNNSLNEFVKQKNFGDYKSAVYAFQKATEYRERIQSVGISLLIADFYEQDYLASKGIYLKKLYDDGNSLLLEKRFAEAEQKFTEIKQVDPNYKDAGSLGDVAFLEPLYQQGQAAMQLGHYREAYDLFGKVSARKTTYKDATALQRESLAQGRFTIALVDFVNASGAVGMEKKIAAYTLDALTSSDDPFIHVVDRENLQNIINEQHLQMTGIMDENTAVAVGQLVGAKAILTGTVLNYTEKKGTLRSKQRDGYTTYQERVLNRTDGKYYMQTLYRPCSFTEYYNSNSCSVSFQYKLTNIKTGEIITTEILEKSFNDEIIYGRFEGDVNTLWPAGQGAPNMNQNDRKALLAMMSARQELKASGELSNALFGQLALQITSAIDKAVKENVK